jgi:hypothetical protein
MRKLYRFNYIVGITFTAITILLSSCVKTVVKDDNPKGLKGDFYDKSAPLKSYKKLKNYSLYLYPVNNNQAITLDENAEIKLRLRNVGTKKVKIDEWYLNITNNLILYYRPFDLEVKHFDPETWTKVAPKTEANARRFELELMPKNSVLLAKKLDFLEDLQLKEGETKSFLVVAVLNLHSVNVRSNMFSIKVETK